MQKLLPSSSTPPSTSDVPLGKWQGRCVHAGAAALFAMGVVVLVLRLFLKGWPWSPTLKAVDWPVWIGVSAAAFALGIVVFNSGVRYASSFTSSLPVRLLCGFLVPAMAIGLGLSALGMLFGALMPGGGAGFLTCVLWFLGFGLAWAILRAWLSALRRS